MSKFKIKFTYGQAEEDNFKEVSSVHKGPINLSNIYDTLTNPTYEEIKFQDERPPGVQQVSEVRRTEARPNNPEEPKTTEKQKPSEKEIEVVPSVDIISKPSSPKKIHKVESKTEQVEESSRGGRVKQSTSIKPTLDIEEMGESEFNKKKEKKEKRYERPEEGDDIPDQVVLKAPRFKFNPDDDKEGKVKAIKKQYVKAQKAEKYLYSGIPEKSEDDFVGCFGCFNKKNKAYTISNNE